MRFTCLLQGLCQSKANQCSEETEDLCNMVKVAVGLCEQKGFNLPNITLPGNYGYCECLQGTTIVNITNHPVHYMVWSKEGKYSYIFSLVWYQILPI